MDPQSSLLRQFADPDGLQLGQIRRYRNADALGAGTRRMQFLKDEAKSLPGVEVVSAGGPRLGLT